VAGSTYSPTVETDDFWILKLDPAGAIDWQKAYGGEDSDEATCVQETSDGGYVVAGDTESFGAGGCLTLHHANRSTCSSRGSP